MKHWPLAAGLLAAAGAVVTAGLFGLRAQASAEKVTGALVAAELRARPMASTAATAALAAAATLPGRPAPAKDSPKAAPERLSFRQTNTYNGNVVFVPEGCSERYDVVLHFHGAHPYVKELVEKANVSAVVAVYNAGNGGDRYAQAFQPGGTLNSLLRQVAAAAAPWCGGPAAKLDRVALSAWSAGYGAAEKLITRAEDRTRVDAVLLADGLHAGFTDPMRRSFASNALSAFKEFGELAKRGDKLFAVTHSSIMTDGYASTTECSKLLLEALRVPPEGAYVSGRAGSFFVEGSGGQDKAAHIAQFRQMDSTLFSKLRSRWAR